MNAAEAVAAIRRLVASHRSFLITGHERPDGDLVGSAIALKAILAALGKSARIVLADPIPERYRALAGAEGLEVFDDSPLAAEVVFVLDSAELARAGAVAQALPPEAPVVNIDHHLSNAGFGEAAWTEAGRSSTGEMLLELARALDWPLPPEAAAGIYAAILTDTGRFSFANATAASLRAAADLVEAGVSAHEMSRLLYSSKNERELRLLSRALSRLKLAAGGRLSSIALYAADFREFNAVPADAQDFAARSVSMAGVELGFFLYELEAGRRTKVSVRSAGRLDASEFAARFGGGGHAAAAGLMLEMGLDDARRLMEEVGAEALKGL